MGDFLKMIERYNAGKKLLNESNSDVEWYKKVEKDGKIPKPTDGKKMGANDTDAPEGYTAAQLSRLYDALYYAQEAGLDPKEVFKLAPDDMKGEWNYSNWTYTKE
jgi:hypothetical protein